MIFINSAIKQIGQDCLIFNLKTQDFYHGTDLKKEEFNRLFYTLVGGEAGNLPPFKKRNLLLVVLYKEYETNPEAQKLYEREYKVNYLKPEDPPIESLHLIYNIIEFEMKFRLRNQEELKVLNENLNKFVQLEKRIEDYLLFKYYSAVLSLLRNQFKETNNFTMDIIIDINEQFESKKMQKSEFIKFIQIRNSLLRVKTLEQEDPVKNRQDIISHLECLLELTKNQKEDFAIKLGLKIYSLQASTVDYANCIKTLEQLLKILHREMLFGKSHKNLVDQILYISGLLGYYNSLAGNVDEIKRYSKKIEKSLMFLKNKTEKEKDYSKSTIVSQYDFYNIVLQSVSGSQINNNTSIEKSIQGYQSLLGNNLMESDEALLDLYILNQGDPNTSNLFTEKFKGYYDKIKRDEIFQDNQIFIIYLFLYNYLSTLSKNISKNNVKEIRQYAKDIIDYTIKNISKIPFLKELFQLYYFKEVFNRIYYVYIYSFYFDGSYKDAIKEVENYYNTIRIQFELNNNKQSFSRIIKIKGDSLIQLKKYQEANVAYSSIVTFTEDKNSILFNMAICNVFMKNISRARELLDNIGQEELSKNPGKKNLIEALLSKLP